MAEVPMAVATAVAVAVAVAVLMAVATAVGVATTVAVVVAVALLPRAHHGRHRRTSTAADSSRRGGCRVQASRAPISDYLLPAEAPELSSLAVGEHVLERYGGVMDLVGRSSRRSCCFTKNYSRYVKGTGSIVCEGLGDVSGDAGEGGSSGGSTVGKGGGVEVGATTSTPPPLALCPSRRASKSSAAEAALFAPREIARLHGFPDSFTFPPDGSVGRKKQFELLGNSLSVQVVSALLEHVLFAGVEDSFAAV